VAFSPIARYCPLRPDACCSQLDCVGALSVGPVPEPARARVDGVRNHHKEPPPRGWHNGGGLALSACRAMTAYLRRTTNARLRDLISATSRMPWHLASLAMMDAATSYNASALSPLRMAETLYDGLAHDAVFRLPAAGIVRFAFRDPNAIGYVRSHDGSMARIYPGSRLFLSAGEHVLTPLRPKAYGARLDRVHAGLIRRACPSDRVGLLFASPWYLRPDRPHRRGGWNGRLIGSSRYRRGHQRWFCGRWLRPNEFGVW
jgi:hypothetical protein